MSIKLFERPLGSFQVLDDFINKRIHIVCPAVNSLTIFNAFACLEGGITDKQAGELAKKVNDQNETGTLWPKLSMSIIPLTKYNGRDDSGKKEIIRKHIQDSFLAQTKYINSPEILFVFEKAIGFDNEMAVKVFFEEAEKFKDKMNIYYLKE